MVTCVGTVDGREVAVIANDFTVKAGTWGKRTFEKITRTQEIADEAGRRGDLGDHRIEASRNRPQPAAQGLENMAYPELALLVDGQRITTGLPTRPVIDPATEAVLGHLPHADPVLLERAARAAAAGFAQWRAVPAHERAALLHEAAALLRRRAETVAADLTTEQGKPLAEAQLPVARGGAAPDRDITSGRRDGAGADGLSASTRADDWALAWATDSARGNGRRPDSDRTETPR